MKRNLLALLIIPILFASCGNDKKFIEGTKTTLVTINTATDIAGGIASTYSTVWSKAIDTRTFRDEYIGRDFNVALEKTHEEILKIGMIKTLDSAQALMEKTIKVLKDHPSKYEEIYNQTITCYGYTTELISLARSPKGSLVAYTAKCNELKSRIAATMKEIDVRLPE